jgi:hypothetical protein
VSAFITTRDTSFPGWIAILPVAGTATLLWAGTKEPRLQSVDASRFRPVQFIGDISYELYLWHWPLIVLFTTLLGKSPGWKWSVVLVTASIGLAWLTTKYIDDPVRRAPWRLSNPLVAFASLATATAVVLAFALVPATILDMQSRADLAMAQATIDSQAECFGAQAIVNDCEDPYQVTSTVDPVSAKTDNMYSNGVTLTSECVVDFDHSPELQECILNEPPTPSHKIVLMGDSHAYVLAAALKLAAEENNWSAESISATGGCRPFGEQSFAACDEWADEHFQNIVDDPQIDTVLLSFSSDFGARLFLDRVKQLKNAGKTVIIFNAVSGVLAPFSKDDPRHLIPECIDISEASYDPCSWIRPLVASVVYPETVSTIDPWDIICADEKCHNVIGGATVYFDSHHMTTSFTRTLAPWLGASILAIYSK